MQFPRQRQVDFGLGSIFTLKSLCCATSTRKAATGLVQGIVNGARLVGKGMVKGYRAAKNAMEKEGEKTEFEPLADVTKGRCEFMSSGVFKNTKEWTPYNP